MGLRRCKRLAQFVALGALALGPRWEAGEVRMDYLPAGPARPDAVALAEFWAAAQAANPGISEERITGLDGPSVRDVEIWKPLHQRFWDGELAPYGLAVTDKMLVLVERFELIYAGADTAP